MLTMLARLLNALNSESAPWQLSLAIVMGMFVGLGPIAAVYNIFILFLACIIRINLSAFILSVLGFSGIAYFVDQYSIAVGESLLNNPEYIEMWTQWYQNEWLRILAFNHTLTLGAIVLSCILSIPVYLLSLLLVKVYRDRFLSWINKLKIMQVIKGSKFYTLYQMFNQ